MTLFFNPYVILGAILALLATFGYGHHKGWTQRDQEVQIEVAKKNAESREKEQKLTEQINEQSYKLKEANDAVTEKQSALDRAIRAGRVRLPASSCVPATQSAAAPSGNRDETVSESDRETLRLIAQIAADGDRAIVQLNACIDAYNQVRETINGDR